MKGQKKEKCLTPEYYGWPKNIQITVNELYKMQQFIDYKQFKELIRDKRGNIIIAESSYLKFKSDIKSVYGTIPSQKKYPPYLFQIKCQTRYFSK